MVRGVWRFYQNAFRGLPREVWTLSLVLLVHRSGTMVLPFLSLHLKDHLELSASFAALLLSVYGLGSVIGSYLGGLFTSRFGALRVVTCSLAATAPLFLLLLRAETVSSAGLTMFVLSMVGDAVRPAAMTATAEFCAPSALGRAYALNRLAINLGMSIGPALAGLLYLNHFEWIFYIDATSCVVAAGMVLALFGWPSIPTGTAPGESKGQVRLTGDWPLLLTLGQFSFVIVVFLQTICVYPIYLREQCGISEATIGGLFAINTILIILFEMVLITAIQPFNKLAVIGVGCSLICFGFGLLPFGSSLLFICATVIVWTVGEMLAMPLISTWVGQRAPPHLRGQYMGAMTAVFSFGWVAAPLLGGWLYSLHPNAIWIASLVIGAVVGAGFLILAASQSTTAKPGLVGE